MRKCEIAVRLDGAAKPGGRLFVLGKMQLAITGHQKAPTSFGSSRCARNVDRALKEHPFTVSIWVGKH
jgi:hypothetical protein